MTPVASAAGMAVTSSWRIAGLGRGMRRFRAYPARDAALHVRASCATPANGIVQTSHSTTGASAARAANMAAMTMTFSSTGAAAATANRPVAFRIPEKSAASDMKKM